MREIYICKEFNKLANFKNLYPHKMQFNIFVSTEMSAKTQRAQQ